MHTNFYYNKSRITGETMSPFFALHGLNAQDRVILARQMQGHNFDPSLMLGGASRCRHGIFRVLVCAPVQNPDSIYYSGNARTCKALKPFPTTFWLVCPYLSRHAGTVEANSGVKRLEHWLNDNPDRTKTWREYNILHQVIRLNLLDFIAPAELKFLRRFKPGIFNNIRRGSIGGIKPCNNNYNAKCLHLQTASFLALGHHPGADWLIQERLGPENCCDNNYCAAKFLAKFLEDN